MHGRVTGSILVEEEWAEEKGSLAGLYWPTPSEVKEVVQQRRRMELHTPNNLNQKAEITPSTMSESPLERISLRCH